MGRGDEIKNEWKFETRAKLEAGDLKMTAIIKVFVVSNISHHHLTSLSRTPQPTSYPTFHPTEPTTALLPVPLEQITVKRIMIFIMIFRLYYCTEK